MRVKKNIRVYAPLYEGVLQYRLIFPKRLIWIFGRPLRLKDPLKQETKSLQQRRAGLHAQPLVRCAKQAARGKPAPYIGEASTTDP